MGYKSEIVIKNLISLIITLKMYLEYSGENFKAIGSTVS